MACWGSSDSRYESVNFENSSTVEFRFCKSASNYEDFVNRIMFVKSIVDFIIKRKITAKDIYDYRKRVETKYLNFIKKYPFANAQYNNDGQELVEDDEQVLDEQVYILNEQVLDEDDEQEWLEADGFEDSPF